MSSEFPIDFRMDLLDEDFFDETCCECVNRFFEIEGGHRGPIHAKKWLRTAAYLIVGRALSDEDKLEVLLERIERYGRRERGRQGSPNVFQLGLLAIFAHVPADPNSSKVEPNEAERRRMGCQLLYAYDHFIPPLFLEGFIKEVSVAAAEQHAGSGHIEPKYRDWVISQLADKQVFEARRLSYSDAIRSAALEIRENREDWSRSLAGVHDRITTQVEFERDEQFGVDEEGECRQAEAEEVAFDFARPMYDLTGDLSRPPVNDEDDEDDDWGHDIADAAADEDYPWDN